MNARRRIRRMQAGQTGQVGQAPVSESPFKENGRLKKGWRYPGSGQPPVKLEPKK